MQNIAFGVVITVVLLVGLVAVFNALSGFLPRQSP